MIEQINGRGVTTVDQVRARLDAVSERPAVLLITRGGAELFVPLRAQRG